jgi:hypothetical protein
MIAAILAACSAAAQPPLAATAPGAIAPDAIAQHTRTFNFTGRAQSFKVPKGVKAVTVDAYGAAGGAAHLALGERTRATVTVTQGETLHVFVGGGGTSGFNGGAPSGCQASGRGGFGGGASDVREGGTAPSNRIVVAGGGAGEGVSKRGGRAAVWSRARQWWTVRA